MILNLQGDWDYADPTTGLFSDERFWLEKASWAENGDRTPEGQHCIRIGGHHYVAMPSLVKPEGLMGFGGRIMRWADRRGGIYRSNNVWHQGEIPMEFRDRLYDNARWLPVEGPRTVQEGVAAALERMRES